MRRGLLAGTLAGLTLVVAACSSSPGKGSSSAKTPVQAVTDAVNRVGSGGSGTLTLSLFGSAADFDALSTTAASKKTDALANKLIPNSSVTLSFQKGSTPSTGSGELDLKLNGEDRAVDVIISKHILYAKADVKGIGSATGANTSKLTTQAGALAAEIPAINDLLAGKYVSLDLNSVSGLLKQVAGAGASGSTTTSVPASELKQIEAQVRAALLTNSQITKVGSDSVGDHYQVVVQGKQLVQSLSGSVSQLAGPLASQLGSVNKDVNKVPAKPVTVDTWVSGGKLKQIEVDLRQFHQGAGGPSNPVGIKVAVSDSGSVSVPSGATPVDLTKVAGLLGGLLG